MKILAAVAVLACVGSACNAQIWNVNLNGSSEVPPNASPATGSATLTYNAGTNTFAWTVQWSGLVAPYSASHFHIAAPGFNGPVSIGFSETAPGSGLAIGSATPTAAFVTALNLGNVYINVHTSAFPGGEIRGQVPTPGSAALLAVAGVGSLRRRRR